MRLPQIAFECEKRNTTEAPTTWKRATDPLFSPHALTFSYRSVTANGAGRSVYPTARVRDVETPPGPGAPLGYLRRIQISSIHSETSWLPSVSLNSDGRLGGLSWSPLRHSGCLMLRYWPGGVKPEGGAGRAPRITTRAVIVVPDFAVMTWTCWPAFKVGREVVDL
jgi:hypothetical protein